MSEQKAKEIHLSSKGLAQLRENYYENDFTFIVDGLEYHCPCWVADFVSPRISRLRSSDATIRKFCLEVKNLSDSFERLLFCRHGSVLK
jgi:hypothetical protein